MTLESSRNPVMSNRSTEYIMEKLQEVIPQIKNTLRQQMKQQMQIKFNQLLHEKRQKLKQQYTNNIKSQINKINLGIRQQISDLEQKCQNKKLQGNRKRALTQIQQQQLIQNTAYNLLNDQSMLRDIKIKITPKVQQRVNMILDYDMQKCCDQTSENIEQQLQITRKQWQQQRRQHWKQKAQSDLQLLAEEYRELQCKKTLIEQSLQTKKSERDAVKKKLKEIMKHNEEIFRLKKQIQLLSQEI